VRVARLKDDDWSKASAGAGWWHKTLTSCAVSNCLFVCDYWNVHKVDLLTDNAIRWRVVRGASALSVNDASHVLVTCWRDNEIREYKPDGQLIHTIKLQGPHVTGPFHVLQLSGSQFVVSHLGSVHGVSSVDEQGRRIATRRDGESSELLNVSRYLAVTKKDSVLVAVDCCNNRLAVLDASMQNARDLILPIDGGLNRPGCLYFNESLGQLYVGEAGGERVIICDNIGFD